MSAPRYQHVRFCKLKVGEDFFYGKFRYTKASYLTGTTVLDGELVVVMPWTKVRSTRPFGKVKQAPIFFHGPASERKILCENECGDRATSLMARVPQKRDGGDRTPEAIGGNEKCPSA